MLLDWCQQIHATQQHAIFPCVSLASMDDPLPFQGSKRTQQLLQTSRICPPSNRQKHVSSTNVHQFWPKHAVFFFLFACGMGVATPKIHQAARTKKFVAVKGETACKTSDACWGRSKKQSWPVGDGFWLLRTFRRIAAENQNMHLRFSAKVCMFWVFFAKTWLFRDEKRHVAPASAELLQNAAELGNPQPQKCKTDQILPDCPKQAFFQICPKFLSFCRSKKSGAKNGQGGFSGRWQTRLPAQFPKKISEVARVWDGKPLGRRWHCYGNNAVDQERCKVWGWLRLLWRMDAQLASGDPI